MSEPKVQDRQPNPNALAAPAAKKWKEKTSPEKLPPAPPDKVKVSKKGKAAKAEPGLSEVAAKAKQAADKAGPGAVPNPSPAQAMIQHARAEYEKQGLFFAQNTLQALDKAGAVARTLGDALAVGAASWHAPAVAGMPAFGFTAGAALVASISMVLLPLSLACASTGHCLEGLQIDLALAAPEGHAAGHGEKHDGACAQGHTQDAHRDEGGQ